MTLLPFYPQVVPGELLSSYVIRLAVANEMRPTRLTNLLGLTTFWKGDPDVAVTPAEITALAEVSGRPLAVLQQCSVMPLLQRLHADPRPDASPRYLVTTGRHRGVQGVRGHPTCVACLREADGAALRIWRLTTSVVCERHGAALIDTCPKCQTPLHHARAHLDFAQRYQVVVHRPEMCLGCQTALPDPPPLASAVLAPALRVQRMMAQATDTGRVEWGEFTLSADEFQGILESVMRLHFPSKAQTGQSKWRPETCHVYERLNVMVAAGEDLSGDLLNLLRRWRARDVFAHEVLRAGGGVPTWFRDLTLLSLATDARHLPPVLTGRKTFGFTERQWRIISAVLPLVPRTSRHGKPVRSVLTAWFTRNMKGTLQKEWTGASTGHVSYPTMSRRIRQMRVDGSLDRVIECMRTHLPESMGRTVFEVRGDDPPKMGL